MSCDSLDKDGASEVIFNGLGRRIEMANAPDAMWHDAEAVFAKMESLFVQSQSAGKPPDFSPSGCVLVAPDVPDESADDERKF